MLHVLYHYYSHTNVNLLGVWKVNDLPSAGASTNEMWDIDFFKLNPCIYPNNNNLIFVRIILYIHILYIRWSVSEFAAPGPIYISLVPNNMGVCCHLDMTLYLKNQPLHYLPTGNWAFEFSHRSSIICNISPYIWQRDRTSVLSLHFLEDSTPESLLMGK